MQTQPRSTKAAGDIDRLVGQRIQIFRKARGLSQTALGTAVGVTFQQVQKYEKGRNRVGAGRLRDIATFLEIPVSSLFADSDSEGGDGETLAKTLALLANPGAIDLLQAYAQIMGPVLRTALINTARQFARAPSLTLQHAEVA